MDHFSFAHYSFPVRVGPQGDRRIRLAVDHEQFTAFYFLFSLLLYSLVGQPTASEGPSFGANGRAKRGQGSQSGQTGDRTAS